MITAFQKQITIWRKLLQKYNNPPRLPYYTVVPGDCFIQHQD